MTAPAAPPASTIAHALAGLKAWRAEVAMALAELRRWALVHELIDPNAATRLAHLERRLLAERLAIAFVAEVARGKSELINALFFADFGARLLPSLSGQRTLCATEILHDPAQPSAIRLLPVETRESPQALREFAGEADAWTVVPLDLARPETLAEGFSALAQTQSLEAARARDLGFAAAGDDPVVVPRWRHAIVNIPHPLLDLGVTILDTPGLEVLASEPELTLHRLPEADAIVFMLSAEDGVTPADATLWRDHVQPIEDSSRTHFVVMNRIDALRDGRRSETEVTVETERRAREAARALGIGRDRLHPVSARQGLAGRLEGDAARLAASRLPQLERALAQALLRARRDDHAASVRAEAHAVLAETRALLASRRTFVEERVAELGALHGKNRKLVDALDRKAADEHARLEETRAALNGVRAVHHRHAAALEKLLDPEAARAAGVRARAAVLDSAFSGGIHQAIDGYFGEIRSRLEKAIAAIDEVGAMMKSVGERYAQPLGLAAADLAAFPTERFRVELDRLEEHCRRDFRSASSLLVRGRHALAALFFDTVALKAVRVFEIADREVRTWMGAFIRPLEAQVHAIADRARNREEGIEKMRDADSGLTQRLEALRRFLSECGERQSEWAVHESRIARLLERAAGERAVSARE